MQNHLTKDQADSASHNDAFSLCLTASNTSSENLGALFADLERRVQATIDLTAQVRTALQGAEKDHVVSVSCRDDTLVVLADSAAWCPRIRYAQQQVLDAPARRR